MYRTKDGRFASPLVQTTYVDRMGKYVDNTYATTHPTEVTERTFVRPRINTRRDQNGRFAPVT